MRNKDLPSKGAITLYFVVSFLLFYIFINADNGLNLFVNLIFAFVAGIPATIVVVIAHIVIEMILDK